jgi:MFS transporter, SP family, sugar:H+ symporter
MVAPESSPRMAFVFLISAVAAIGGFLFGFDTAVINGAVTALKSHFGANDWTIGLAVSLALLGSAGGALFAGPAADRYGRVPLMRFSAVLFAASAVGSGFPFTIHDFIAWRVLGGVAVGAASVLAPAYIAEVAPPAWRGRLGSLQQLAIVSGIFCALLANYGIVRLAGSAEAPFWGGAEAWRWMFWSEIPASLLFFLGVFFIPESPRYLVAKGRDPEAAAVFARIDPAEAAALVDRVRSSLQGEVRARWKDLRGNSGLLPIVWVGIGLSAFQQFVGINVIFYYSSTLWRAVGFSEENSLFISMITGLINIGTTLAAMACVDRFGRKPLLLVGSIGMTATLGILAVAFSRAGLDAAGSPVLEGPLGLVALIAANLYVVCFGFSWGPVVWVMLGEMFPNRLRGKALALAAALQWVANFLVSTTFPPISGTLGLGTAYGIYTAFALASFFFVQHFTRETKGRTLEEMG